MERVSAVKHTFTVEDVVERASAHHREVHRHGATRMRTHVEVDPKVGLRGLEGVKALIDRYKWAIDLEICVMPQEGLTNNPGTDELMVAALKNGATVVGAAPNYDTDRRRRSAASSRWRASSTSTSTCISTAAPRPRSSTRCWSAISPRNTAGAAGSPSAMSQARHDAPAGHGQGRPGAWPMPASPLTVLTATDLYLGGRHTDHNVPRNVRRPQPAHRAGRASARSPPTTSSIPSRRSATASCCARSTCRRSSPSAATTTRCARSGT